MPRRGGREAPPYVINALGRVWEEQGWSTHAISTTLLVGTMIRHFGSAEAKAEVLSRIASGDAIFSLGYTEPGCGSDVFAARTRAVRDGDGWRIDGTKIFISNGPVADVVIVFAMTDPAKGYHGGVTGFLVEAGAPGFRVSKRLEKMGLRSSPLGELSFEGVRVPDSAVLGGVGAGSTSFTRAMDWERICLFASHIGQMERLLEKAVQYARQRSQFGQTIGKFQAVAHKISDMKVQLEAARLLTYRAAWRLERSRTSSLDASMAKLFVSESLVRAALDTVQIFGCYGFMTEYDVERSLRDAIASTLYSGTSEMQRNIIARWLGL